ncbi:MAG: ABC transporter ATP-binding protein [Clostridium sp.]
MKNNLCIKLENLNKSFGKHVVLENINLNIQRGLVVGIVGGNGSGKTTLLKLILGLSYPTSGYIEVNGRELKPGMLGNLPTNVGGLIENPGFVPGFSGLDNLLMLASIRNKISKEDIVEWMKRLGLDPNNKKKVEKYSLGMKQKMGIIQAIMENPDIVLFDEPTNALDHKSVGIFNEIVKEKALDRTTFVVVSHKKEEIDNLCDIVYEIKEGKLELIQEKKVV